MKMVLDDLQNVQYLKHFAESGQSPIPRRESGLIVESKLGPENAETGELEEISSIYFHTAVKSRFYPEEKEQELMKKIDKKYWIDINDTFVMYGQNICKPISPMCDVCKIKKSCKYYKTKNVS